MFDRALDLGLGPGADADGLVAPEHVADVEGHAVQAVTLRLEPGDDGVEVSFGQWQKLALARGFMRDRPLLLALDDTKADGLMQVLREGRGAWMTMLRVGRGRALLLGDAIPRLRERIVELDTLEAQIDRDGGENHDDLFLKMDVEGWEWASLDGTSDDDLLRFRQIVIELHGLTLAEGFDRQLGQRPVGGAEHERMAGLEPDEHAEGPSIQMQKREERDNRRERR